MVMNPWASVLNVINLINDQNWVFVFYKRINYRCVDTGCY